MYRQLPIVMIGRVAFYVDAAREELWRKANPSDTIPFSAFSPSEEGFTCLYDKRVHTAFQSVGSGYRNCKSHFLVILPALAALDPEGIALRYGIPIGDLTTGGLRQLPQKLVARMIPVARLIEDKSLAAAAGLPAQQVREQRM